MNGFAHTRRCDVGRALLAAGCLLQAGLDRPALAGESLVPEAETWLAGQPKEEYDLDALGAKLTTPRDAFAYVRDEIAYEPYAGVMKGAAGALLTHGANDADRALLLARLLAAQGINVNLVRGALPSTAARALADDIARGPDAVTRLLAGLPPVVPLPKDETPQQKEFHRLFLHRAADRAGVIRLDEESQQPILASALSDVAGPATAPAASPARHVWIQAVIEGKTVDLDPSRSDAKFGEAPAAADDTWSIDALPDELYHTITLRLVEERLAGARLERQELVAHDLRAADLSSAGLRLAIMPKTAPEAAGDFRPLVLAGDDVFEGTTFRLSGVSVAPPEPAGAGGLLGGFGGGTEPEAKPKPAADDPNGPRLGRLWAEVVFHSPGLPDETVRRMIIDRVEPQADGWRLVAALADERVVRPLLLQVWDAALDLGAPHPLALMQAQVAALRTLDPVRVALAEGRKLSPGDLPAPASAPQLMGFFLASGLKRHQLGLAGGSQVRSFFERPRLAFLRHGFVVADWTNPAAAPRYQEGIDLVNAPIRFSGSAGPAAWRAGLADTILEQYVLNRPALFNTISLMAAVQNQKVALVTVSSAAQLDRISVVPAIRSVLADELAKGRVLVAPVHPVAFAGIHAFGWWSLDPTTGYAIGKMELGGAQGLVEYGETNEKIAEWTETYVKFLGNVLKCYTTAIAGALGSVNSNFNDVQDTVTIAHGNNPLPSSNALIDCVRDAACDALKDFLQTEMNSAAIMGEAEGVEELLVKFAYEESAAQGAGAAAGKICGKLLGGDGKK